VHRIIEGPTIGFFTTPLFLMLKQVSL